MPPCRELCEAAKEGCEGLMVTYGFAWPETLACENLLLHADGECYMGGAFSETDTGAGERFAAQWISLIING